MPLMEGQPSTNGNSNARTQGESHADSNNCMNQSSPMQENQGGTATPTDEEQTQTINVDDGDTNSKKRKLTSVVWNHFKKLKVDGEDKAECMYCKKKLGGKSKNGTKHLHDHFNSCPRRNCKNIRQQVLGMGQKNQNGEANISCLNFDPEKSRKDLAEMVIVHEYPLVMVEHHGFRKFVVGLQPLFKVPCRNTLKKDILKIYDFEKDKTMRLLEKNQSKIAVTTDMWTASNKKKCFMAITAHLVSDNWEMQSRIMRFIYGSEKSNSEIEKLKKLMYRLFQDYEASAAAGSSRNRHGVDSSRNTSDGEGTGFFNDYYTIIEEDNHTGNTSELDHYLQEKV